MLTVAVEAVAAIAAQTKRRQKTSRWSMVNGQKCALLKVTKEVLALTVGARVHRASLGNRVYTSSDVDMYISTLMFFESKFTSQIVSVGSIQHVLVIHPSFLLIPLIKT